MRDKHTTIANTDLHAPQFPAYKLNGALPVLNPQGLSKGHTLP